MGTEPNEDVVRKDIDRSTDDLEQTVERYHRRLADAAALLQLEIEGLWREVSVSDDRKKFDKLTGLIREAAKALDAINDIEAKVGLSRLDERNALNLEDARAEILGRLARIAAAEGEGSVSG